MKKLLGILIILCSCSSGKEYNEPQFVEKEEIRGEYLSDDLMISYAYDMAVDDQYIYILAYICTGLRQIMASNNQLQNEQYCRRPGLF